MFDRATGERYLQSTHPLLREVPRTIRWYTDEEANVLRCP